jgi:hypothetical protein
MDLRRVINELVYDCRALDVRLHSNEQDKVTEVDLVILRAQLFLLDVAAANLQELKRLQREQASSK